MKLSATDAEKRRDLCEELIKIAAEHDAAIKRRNDAKAMLGTAEAELKKVAERYEWARSRVLAAFEATASEQ